jgi:hypothetical protein
VAHSYSNVSIVRDDGAMTRFLCRTDTHVGGLQAELAVAMFICQTKLRNRTPQAAKQLPDFYSFVRPFKSCEREGLRTSGVITRRAVIIPYLVRLRWRAKPEIVVNTSSNPMQVLNIRLFPPLAV